MIEDGEKVNIPNHGKKRRNPRGCVCSVAMRFCGSSFLQSQEEQLIYQFVKLHMFDLFYYD